MSFQPTHPTGRCRAFKAPALRLQRVLCILPLIVPSLARGIEITEFGIDATTVTLMVQDDGSSNSFEVRESLGLGEGSWTASTGVTLVPVGGNRYRISVPRSEADRRFFRVIGSFLTTGLDPDGDGLPSAFEEQLSGDPGSLSYSDPAAFDTDGDGFSDGVEYALGTEPNNPESFPDQASLPAVYFVDARSVATEGTSPHLIEIEGDGGFSGTVYYSINDRGTAVSPDDFLPLSGRFDMVNGVGSIPLQPVDDFEISPQRLVMIDLATDPPGNAYRAAGNVTHVVSLGENDNYWSGVFRDEVGERNFRVRMLHGPSTTELAFVSGTSDGLPAIDAGASSQSTGVIPIVNLAGEPQEVFPASGVVHAPSRFAAASPEMPVSRGGIFGEVGLKRQLTLDANPSQDPSHTLGPNTIVGGFTEEVRHASDPTVTYLNADLAGVFVLTRELPDSPEINSALRPE